MTNFPKITLFLLVVFIFLNSSFAQKPNVVLIMTDDQGSRDLNCLGAEDLYTPNLDKLFSEGVSFNQFYVGSAVCSPSRAALLTGKTPQKAGVPGNVGTKAEGLPTSEYTMAEMFKDNGYTTALIGKWHLGHLPETVPPGQGFEYSIGHLGGCIDNHSHFFYWSGPNKHDLFQNGKEVYRDKFFPQLMLEEAETFISNNKEKPFFMYYAMNSPHYPLQPTAKWREYYKDLEMPRRDYAGFVSMTDEYIGELLELLDMNGIRENTIVVFLSDHGHSYETRTFGSGGYSGIYRSGKGSLFDGGIRVPAVIRWPGKLEAGVKIEQLCMSMDIYPTLAELCSFDNVPSDIDGLSMVSVIKNDEPSKHQLAFWQLGNQWAVRKGNWKLIGNPKDHSPKGKYLNDENDRLFLSNLSQDPSEMKNFAEKYPQKVEELLNDYKNWDYSKPKNIPEK